MTIVKNSLNLLRNLSNGTFYPNPFSKSYDGTNLIKLDKSDIVNLKALSS